LGKNSAEIFFLYFFCPKIVIYLSLALSPKKFLPGAFFAPLSPGRVEATSNGGTGF
jgi:hypothetical protein